MPTLSVVKTDFGKLAKWGAIIIGVLIVLFVIIKVLLMIKEAIFPSPPPAPTLLFGKLPPTNFPEGVEKNFTYEIDTITGDLPNLPPSSAVYKMEQKGPDILAVQKAGEKVSKLGFNSRPQQISDFVYRWTSDMPPEQNIVLNIKLSEFSLSSAYLKYEKNLKEENFKEKSEPIGAAEGFLKGLEFYPEDIDEDKTKVDLFYLDQGVISPTTRIVSSNMATVYFFQKDKDEVPIVYPQRDKSTMSLTIGAGRLNLKGKILEGKFSYQKILDESATYPIKTAQQALDDLKSGNGYIASHTASDGNVLIKKVYLALFYEGQLQEYLMPVVVFEGNNDFYAIVPAVSDDWIDN